MPTFIRLSGVDTQRLSPQNTLLSCSREVPLVIFCKGDINFHNKNIEMYYKNEKRVYK